MDVITLRKLTRKSKIGYGSYANLTVEQMLERNMYGELVWLYYHVQWLTFTDDILQEIRVFDPIQKPGINHDMYEKRIIKRMNARYNGLGAAILDKKKQKKRRLRAEYFEEKVVMSKQKLQAINHGHIKYF